ncbi:Outer membrane protein OmpA [Cribrihabitans marinus]|uniref:Outer membrane protein OmpA n=1 Tax=Cribrihabitans marinus TaxID=1227549 RepID=A0A1H7APD6_9RHOB|nr:OmpA family protein [Cribrihabitans marinus]GGH32052.1 membrane protein [Cribrihabitans marinus]SEJ66494.1 Outer membrane protein OmpA [Cribrihabitans marinus]
MQKWIVALGLSASLSACGYEAGQAVDSGTFGNATLNNIQMSNGERSFVQALGERFAREVPNQVNFAFDSAQLDPSARQILAEQANWIRQFPEVRFRVYGHTDLVGSNAYNKSLGLRRAQAVVAYLASQGISRSRLEALVSFGETRPVIQTSNRDRRNRRTVTEVSGVAGGRGQLLDGRYAEVIYRDYIRSAEPASTLSVDTRATGFEQQ